MSENTLETSRRKSWIMPLSHLAFIAVTLVLALPARADPIYGHLDQDKTNCTPMGCGPTAAVNSFIFLQNKYPDIYDHKLVASDSQADMVKVVDDLIDLDKGYMVTDCKADGTYYAAFITGKQKYIEDKVPGKTVYNARVWFAWDTALGGDKPAYVTDQTAPTAAWMLKEVQDGEDVEILLDSTGFQHYVTVTGFTWFDANDDGKVDPGEYSIDFVDPKGGKDVESVLSRAADGRLTINYDGKLVAISVAVSESPTPEPGALLLVGPAVVLLVSIRASRRAIRACPSSVPPMR
jgi:hypothetical protein